MLDQTEIEHPGLFLAENGSVIALRGRQHHCPCHRGVQLHRTVIAEDYQLFGVYAMMNTITLGWQKPASRLTPNARRQTD